ncbi:GtrA family protein [Chitinophagaceae bacterium LB-8]|uniref:GtrA family protein n=1 Tax=Paraflavisolibacter caeni TaxID=2982496 RepID=A0A9X3BIL2_9BACT|nr:GtrA family protein [Paraflavisolibacter caeni]MCU7551572.1 GtrA family protein [Paraflavisolibacter caeni]
MHKIHHQIRKGILGLVDFFYPVFRRFMPLQTYRYAACGGGNTVLNIFIFFFAHNFILQNKVVELGFIAVSSHIAAFIIAFCITFPIGFYLSMYVVFQGSFLRRRTQFVRYFMVAMACIGLNYFFLKLFVDVFGLYPTPSMILNTAIVVIFSYLSQKYFSFRTQKVNVPIQVEAPSELRA